MRSHFSMGWGSSNIFLTCEAPRVRWRWPWNGPAALSLWLLPLRARSSFRHSVDCCNNSVLYQLSTIEWICLTLFDSLITIFRVSRVNQALMYDDNNWWRAIVADDFLLFVNFTAEHHNPWTGISMNSNHCLSKRIFYISSNKDRLDMGREPVNYEIRQVDTESVGS